MKGDQDVTADLAWVHPAGKVPETGLGVTRAATPQELESIGRALGLISCPSLEARYEIKPTGAGRYAVSGTLRAEVVQACVVTLDPVTGTIEEDFQAAFWPEGDIPPPRGGILDLDDDVEPEPISGGQIWVGRVIFECLAESLDPYPRTPGAALDWQEPEPASGGTSDSPFAVLANIKTKR